MTKLLDSVGADAPVVWEKSAVEVLGGAASDVNLRRFLRGISAIDGVGLEARAAALAASSIKTTSKAWALGRVIDLTMLEGADTPGRVQSPAAKALMPDPADPSRPQVEAVCPSLPAQARWTGQISSATHLAPSSGCCSHLPGRQRSGCWSGLRR